MICPNCGISIQVDRPNCPNCGIMISQPQYYRNPQAQAAGTYQVQKTLFEQEDKKKTYRLMGIVFLTIGLVAFAVGFVVYYTAGEWLFCGVSFILIGAGLITYLTNLTKKYKNI